MRGVRLICRPQCPKKVTYDLWPSLRDPLQYYPVEIYKGPVRQFLDRSVTGLEQLQCQVFSGGICRGGLLHVQFSWGVFTSKLFGGAINEVATRGLFKLVAA